MTHEVERRLISEIHENNLMLKSLLQMLSPLQALDLAKDFWLNIIANVIGNQITK